MSFLSSTGNMHISVLTQFLIKGDAFNFNEVIMRMWVGFLRVSRVEFLSYHVSCDFFEGLNWGGTSSETAKSESSRYSRCSSQSADVMLITIPH